MSIKSKHWRRKSPEQLRERHRQALANVSIHSIEEFLAERENLTFVSGETEENGAVVYAVYKERPLDPSAESSPTPDIAVIYFAEGGWRLTFIEVKVGRSLRTAIGSEYQEERTMQAFSNYHVIDRFLTAVDSKRFTRKIKEQIHRMGPGYYRIRVTSNGKLSPIESPKEAIIS